MLPLLTGPIFRFRVGRVVELQHSSGRFGYLIAHFKRPRFGTFFTLVTRPFNEPLSVAHLDDLRSFPTTSVWLNMYHLLSTHGESTFRHKGDLPAYTAHEPSFWYGAVDHRITIEHADGTQEIRRTALSEREWESQMEGQGIIQMVVWFPKDIGAFLFDGVPLRWSAHKKS